MRSHTIDGAKGLSWLRHKDVWAAMGAVITSALVVWFLPPGIEDDIPGHVLVVAVAILAVVAVVVRRIYLWIYARRRRSRRSSRSSSRASSQRTR